MSLTTSSKCSVERRMWPTVSRPSGSWANSSCSRPFNPKMAFMGVRNSWPMAATNSSLWALARRMSSCATISAWLRCSLSWICCSVRRSYKRTMSSKDAAAMMWLNTANSTVAWLTAVVVGARNRLSPKTLAMRAKITSR